MAAKTGGNATDDFVASKCPTVDPVVTFGLKTSAYGGGKAVMWSVEWSESKAQTADGCCTIDKGIPDAAMTAHVGSANKQSAVLSQVEGRNVSGTLGVDGNVAMVCCCVFQLTDHGPAGDTEKADLWSSGCSSEVGAILAPRVTTYDGQGMSSNRNVDSAVLVTVSGVVQTVFVESAPRPEKSGASCDFDDEMISTCETIVGLHVVSKVEGAASKGTTFKTENVSKVAVNGAWSAMTKYLDNSLNDMGIATRQFLALVACLDCWS